MEEMSLSQLPLFSLSSRHPGLTRALSETYIEAASVCLDRHHTPPTDVVLVNGSDPIETRVSWTPPDDLTRNAWANETDATRDGAYACALAAVEVTYEMVAVRRAETKTGADYYIGEIGKAFEDLEDCFRLEVSGVDEGDDSAVTYRLKRKIAQAAAGISDLPAIACVVGFKIKKIMMQSV